MTDEMRMRRTDEMRNPAAWALPALALVFTACASGEIDAVAEGAGEAFASKSLDAEGFFRDTRFEQPVGVFRWTDPIPMTPDGPRPLEWHNHDGRVWKVNTGYSTQMMSPLSRRVIGDRVRLEAANSARAIIVESHTEGIDVELGINTWPDFDGNPPPSHSDGRVTHFWPHMILDQDLPREDRLMVDRLGEVRVRFDARLLHAELAPESHPNAHTGHFLFHFLVRDEVGRGFWIGSDLYDARNHRRGGYEATPFSGWNDNNTDLHIFSLRGHAVPLDALHRIMRGEAVSLDFDVHPYLVRALEEMRARGRISEAEKSGFWVSHFNIGWEAPGLFNGRMKVRDLRVDLRPAQPHSVHRFRNVTTDDYLYTTVTGEVMGAPDWVHEGPAFTLLSSGVGPELFRCRRDNNKHFLSTHLDCEGQIREGSLGHGVAGGGRALHRCYSPVRDVHLSTTHVEECGGDGFRVEGEMLQVQ